MSKKLLSLCLVGLIFVATGCFEHHNGNRGPRGNEGPGGNSGGANIQSDCGNINYVGVCANDKQSVTFCNDNGELETVQCGQGKSCQMGDSYYDCLEGEAGNDNPGGQVGGNCGNYTNAGECAKDKKSVTYCSNSGELATETCSGVETCQELDNNGFKYYGCKVKDPTSFGDLKVECGSMGSGGVCSSDNKAYQYCNEQTKTVWAVECTGNTTCQWVDEKTDDAEYHYLDCLEAKADDKPVSEVCGSDFEESCTDNVITFCDSDKVATKKCDDGTTCKLNDSKKYECVADSSTDVPEDDNPGDAPEGERPEDDNPPPEVPGDRP